MAGSVFAFLIFVLFSAHTYANEVPAVLWTNLKSVQYPVSLAGHTLDSDTFYKGYLQQLTDGNAKNVVAFIQDQLSIDEITRYADVFNDNSNGAAYKSLRNIMENFESTHVSSIKEPVNAVDKLLENFRGNTVFVDNAEEVSKLQLNDNEAHFVIVTLPKTTAGRKLETLVDIDDMMGKLTEKLSALGTPFYAVYTAKTRSQVPNIMKVHHGRQLLQSDDTSENYTFFNVSGCLYMYFTKIQLQVLKADTHDVRLTYTIGNMGTQLIEVGCTNSSATFEADFQEYLPSNMTMFKMNMNVSTHLGYWYIHELTLDFTFSYDKGTVTGSNWLMESNKGTLFGVVGYPGSTLTGTSYHCKEQPPIKQYNRTEKTETMVQLIFTDFQLQYDIRKNSSFSDADDCVGFFTLPIWMGLITALVLILILTCGIALLANINTMDRFDDPKGKTIQVAVGD